MEVAFYVWIVPGELAVSPIPSPDEFEEYSKVFSSVVILPEDGELTRRAYDPRAWEMYSVDYLHEPVPDFTSPRLVQILRILRWIEEKKEEGPVLVHCIGGVGRSGTVAVCYLVYSKGRSPKEAIREVREKIPEAATSPDQEKMPEILFNFMNFLPKEEREFLFSVSDRAKYWKSASRVMEISLEISSPIREEFDLSKEDIARIFHKTGENYLREEMGRSPLSEGLEGAIASLAYSLDIYHSQEVRRVDIISGRDLRLLAYSPIEIGGILEEANKRKERLEEELGRKILLERYWPWRLSLGFFRILPPQPLGTLQSGL